MSESGLSHCMHRVNMIVYFLSFIQRAPETIATEVVLHLSVFTPLAN
jgi:hypothetical protein